MPDDDRAWWEKRARYWDDFDWWQLQIDAALDGNPDSGNLRITLIHQELSLAMNRITGSQSGANFHTWAVWGSKTAGRTIRREDVPALSQAGRGLAVLAATGAAAPLVRRRRPARPTIAVVAAAAVASWVIRDGVARAAGKIFAGNATVVDDIGRQTARFVSQVGGSGDQVRLDEFRSGLRPGPASRGGQELLAGAYRHYFWAAREADPDRRDELMLCANLLAILHEHQRLEPYLDAAVPWALRRLVTERLLSFSVGSEAMKVSADVPTVGGSSFPKTLATIEDPELNALLVGPGGWDRTPDTTAGSAAHDWTKLSDRMNFIVDLFRSRQQDPNLFTAPYTAAQREVILDGGIRPARCEPPAAGPPGTTGSRSRGRKKLSRRLRTPR